MTASIDAHLNAVGTANPPHEVHGTFLAFAEERLPARERAVFRRMAARSGIARRWSFLEPAPAGSAAVDADGFYRRGAFPGTAARMERYARDALALARAAVDDLAAKADLDGITHLVCASCTGFVAPGVDQRLAAALGLSPRVERVAIGFMGCAAAVNALAVARHIVRSEPQARVLVVTVELCTLHLQDDGDLEGLLAALLFGDGAAAALVTARPEGFRLRDFRSVTIPDTPDVITWSVGDRGFLMHLGGEVPGRIGAALRAERARNDSEGVLRGLPPEDYDLFAIHPGGRTVLDAVAQALDLPDDALAQSRAVLAAHGNMSSATVLFVLARMLAERVGERGVAMAFGPGMVAETFRFARAA